MNLFSSMMSTQTEQFWTVYGLTMMVSVIISLAISLFVVVCRWKLFTKAGEAGWASLIPYYSLYVECKIAGKKVCFWVISIVSTILSVATCIYLSSFIDRIIELLFSTAGFDRRYMSLQETDDLYQLAGELVVLWAIIMIVSIVLLIFNIIRFVGLSKSFGQTGWYALGFLFVPYVFYAVFAFSRSIQYVGDGRYVNNMNGMGYNPYGQPQQ